jgi:subtilisin family serine protease
VATGTAIRVGVIDTGIDAQHPDLAAHFRGGFDFVDNDSDPADLNGHGTHVAGTIAALDNNLGVVGVAPNVEIFALRVLGASGSGTTTDVILAVDWAIANQLHVLNLSLGSSDSALSEEQAFQKAADAGIVVFAASGNCFTGCEEFPEGVKERVDFPAAYSTVISVGAVDSGSRVASFSQRGGQLEFVAPGVGVLSTSRTGLSDIADVAFVDQSFFEADRFTLSPLGEVSGEYVFCGLGKPEEIPSGVSGKIALISRGETKFGDKVRNAMAAGARAAIIYNNKPANDPDGGTIRGTLCRDFDAANNCINQDDLIFPYILTISISKEDGEAMLNTNRGLATVSARPDDYAFLNGTSMATPHAAGVGALIWSVAPNATRAQIIDALLTTTVDLGAAGFDTTFGNGLVDAFAAARKLAPEKFVTSPPPPKNVRKRR